MNTLNRYIGDYFLRIVTLRIGIMYEISNRITGRIILKIFVANSGERIDQ